MDLWQPGTAKDRCILPIKFGAGDTGLKPGGECARPTYQSASPFCSPGGQNDNAPNSPGELALTGTVTSDVLVGTLFTNFEFSGCVRKSHTSDLKRCQERVTSRLGLSRQALT
jgi:hypothetical protein